MRTVLGAPVSPYVRKVRVFLAEKNLPYELDPVIPFNVSPEFKKLSPLGKIPAYREDGVTLADSSVICAYLERTNPEPALYPKDAVAFARALWFEEFGDSGLAPIVGPKVFFQRIVGPMFFGQQPDEGVIQQALTAELPPLLDYLEGEVKGATLVGSRFSIADIGICTQFVNLEHAGARIDAARWPNLAKYVAGVLARPSFKAVLEVEAQMLGGLRPQS